MSEQKELVKVYITKYALTTGIMEKMAEMVSDSYACVPAQYDATGVTISYRQHVHGKDFHFNREDAVKQAEKMRVKAIASAKKKIAALEAMKF